jgi:natural product precursor
MKTLNKIKLNNLSAENLSEKQMKEIRGGDETASCSCACHWADQGGSSTMENCSANKALGYFSPYYGQSWSDC